MSGGGRTPGTHATLFHGKPPGEGVDDAGGVELFILGATEDVGAALRAVEAINAGWPPATTRLDWPTALILLTLSPSSRYDCGRL